MARPVGLSIDQVERLCPSIGHRLNNESEA
jgi:hypothetical protein